MAEIPVTSGQSAVAPGEKHVVHLTPAVQLWMIVNAEGETFPHFNCWEYEAQPTNNLVGFSDGSQRTLASSGCRLFSLVSYLSGVGVSVPPVVRGAPQAGDAPDRIRIDSYEGAGPAAPLGRAGPTQFLHFLWAYIAKEFDDPNPSQDTHYSNLLLRNPQGAIPYDSKMEKLINSMVAKSNGGYSTRTFRFGAAHSVSVRDGQEIPGLTAAIRQGHAALLGVGNEKTDHFVLCVGMVKVGGKTYYVVTDSGFRPTDPSVLLPMKRPDDPSPYEWNPRNEKSPACFVIGMRNRPKSDEHPERAERTIEGNQNHHFDAIFSWTPLEGDLADDWRVVSNVEDEELSSVVSTPTQPWNMVTNAPQTWPGFEDTWQLGPTPDIADSSRETAEYPRTPAPTPSEGSTWFSPWTGNN